MQTNFSKFALGLLVAFLRLPVVLPSPASAQATIGMGDGQNTVAVDFYKVPPANRTSGSHSTKSITSRSCNIKRRMAR